MYPNNLISIAPGVSSNASTQFIDANNNPIISNNTCTWQLKNPSAITVLSGSASQDEFTPSIWHATLAIPASLPVLPYGEVYRLIWALTATNGSIWNNTDNLTIESPPPPIENPAGLVTLNNTSINDVLITPQELTNYIHSVVDNYGGTIYISNNGDPITDAVPIVYEHSYAYTDTVPAFKMHEKFNPYWSRWVYQIGAYPNVTVQYPLWLSVPQSWQHISALKTLMEKIKDQESDRELRWTDAELMQHLYIGLNRINLSPPHHTGWLLSDLPRILDLALIKAAQVSAIESRYLAEGMLAFEFTGQSTNLQIDRTQYFSTIMSDVTSWLDTHLADYKRNAIRGAPVQSHNVVSPVFNAGLIGRGGLYIPYNTGLRNRGGWN